MNKTSWFLVALLVVSNTCWLLALTIFQPDEPAGFRTRPHETAVDASRSANRAGPEARGESPERQLPKANRRGQSPPVTPQPTSAVRPGQLARPWIRDVFQMTDDRRRQGALDKIRRALASEDPVLIEAALRALASIKAIDFNKESFRPLVLPCLRSEVPAVRRWGLSALRTVAPKPEDLDLVLDLVADPDAQVRRATPAFLSAMSERRINGRVSDAMLRLLGDQDHEVRDAAISSLYDTTVSAEVDQRLLALFGDPKTRYRTLRFALSTLAKKSEAVVDALIEALDDPDPRVGQSVAWGLQRGVSKAAQSKVSDACLKLLLDRADWNTRAQCLRVLELYGEEAHARAIESWAKDNPAAPQTVPETVAAIRRRIAKSPS